MYILLPLFLGRLLVVSFRSLTTRGVVCGVIALTMFATQRMLYSNSDHIEWPWSLPRNGWEQAFLWVRANTPVNAVIALDAEYISMQGEDAQNFRAISERSMPADISKDGGIAAIRPELTREWFDGVALQRGLNNASDTDRVARLRPRGIGWIVLPKSAQTGLPCPYRNADVSICKTSMP